jgi:hypothetical protein
LNQYSCSEPILPALFPVVVELELRTAVVPVLPAVEVIATEVVVEPKKNIKGTCNLKSM